MFFLRSALALNEKQKKCELRRRKAGRAKNHRPFETVSAIWQMIAVAAEVGPSASTCASGRLLRAKTHAWDRIARL